MAKLRNDRLSAWMAEYGMSAAELADAVNEAIRDLTGALGSTSERSVFRWLAGDVRWPNERQRRALEAVTGRPPRDLGFVPRGKKQSVPAIPEDPLMHRRSLLGAAAGTAAAVSIPLASPAAARPSRVGASDVIRLRDDIERLVALDSLRGGQGLERTALQGAAEATRLQQQSTTQRVRQRLLTLAATFTSAAAWSLIDVGELEGASRHLDRALTLAGLARDPEAAMQVWNLRSMLARQRRDYAEAVAAAQAAQATAVARRSPLHASLAHARAAVGLAHGGQGRSALASLGRAEEALTKVDWAEPRSAWLEFYGPAELYSLSAIVQDLAGRPADAEATSHRALAALGPEYRRNRAHATAWLAVTQLHQNEVEQACATSSAVFGFTGGALPGRLRQLLGDFQRDLIARDPKAAHEWMDRHRAEWSTS
ncbi:XRE family transcriptional regulator [Streptomyces albidoflavus]|uniref:XRE family transcriptional regulator n=1 Tax=Streptomyces albidoflavus TaxID=1886 RepID=UPI001F5DE3E5|nr:XRE family transcriptional regulator [Streptomyces albidoflavus]